MEFFSWFLFVLTAFLGAIYVENSGYADKKQRSNKWVAAMGLTFLLGVASTTLNDDFASYSFYTKHDVTVINDVTYSVPKDVQVTVMTYPWWSINDPVETYHVVGEE